MNIDKARKILKFKPKDIFYNLNLMAKQKDKIKPTKTAVEKIKSTDKEQWFPFGGGCYLVVAKKGNNGNTSKRRDIDNKFGIFNPKFFRFFLNNKLVSVCKKYITLSTGLIF